MKRPVWMSILIFGVIPGLFAGVQAAAYVLAWLGQKLFEGGGNIANMLTLMLVMVMVLATLLVLAERKWSAMMQDRVGPNVARLPIPGLSKNPLFGLPHVAADVLKMLFKEDLVPSKVSRLMFELGPVLAFAPAFALFAVVPAGPTLNWDGVRVPMVVAEPDFGILYLFAIASLAVYGTSLAGWASNNKFELLGGVRAWSQMISYEVGLGLSLVGIFLAFGSVQLGALADAQTQYLWTLGEGAFDLGLPAWGIFLQPYGFILFFAAASAETKRAPFDAPEGESEIIGYFVEYSGMKFGLFMIAEFVEVVVLSGVITVLFLGGWHLPVGDAWLTAKLTAVHPLLYGTVAATVFWLKVMVLCYLQMAVRWTMPRFRYDQIQSLGWKILFPLGLVNLFVTGALVLVDPSLRLLAVVGLLQIGLLAALTAAAGPKKKEDSALAHGHAHDSHAPAPAAAAHH